MDPMNGGDPGETPDHPIPAGAGGVPMKSRFWTGFLLAFCCAHAVFLLTSIMPAPPARDDPGNPAAELYRLVLAGRQQWSMFETIPVLHSMDVRLAGEDDRGEKLTAGCVLPGFRQYPRPEDSRYYVLFYRMMFFDNKVAYRDAYLRNVARELQAQRGPGAGEKWSLVANTAHTRNLFHIRRDGQIPMPLTQAFALPDPGRSSP